MIADIIESVKPRHVRRYFGSTIQPLRGRRVSNYQNTLVVRRDISMNIQYVCLRCRQQATRVRHQVRLASFVPLGGLLNNDHPNGRNPAPVTIVREGTQTDAPSKSDSSLLQPLQQQNTQLPFSVDKILASLFSSNQRGKSNRLQTRYSGISRFEPQDICAGQDPLKTDIAILKRMLYKENASLKDLWAQLKNVLELEAFESSKDKYSDDKATLALQGVSKDILVLISRSRSSDLVRDSIPVLSEVIRLLVKNKLMRYHWEDILWIKTGALLQSISRPAGVPPVPEACDPLRAIPVLEEVLDVWEIFVEEYGQQQPATRVQIKNAGMLDDYDKFEGSMLKSSLTRDRTRQWQGLPKDKDARLPYTDALNNVPQRFLLCLPRHPNQPVDGIIVAANLTHDCVNFLIQHSLIPETTVQNAQPFLAFVKNFRFKRSFLREIATRALVKQGIPSGIVDKALRCCGLTQATAREDVSSSEGLAPPNKTFTEDNTTRKTSQVRLISKDLARAVQRSDTGLAIGLWRRFRDNSMPNGDTESLREEIFTQFLSSFFSLRRPGHAVDVWNVMVRSGLIPRQKHWQAMIVGCTKSKDLVSMQEIWTNMKAAGFEPDNKSWTAWIHGLIKCGEWHLGLGALEELGRLWRNAPVEAKTDNGGTGGPLPTIEPVNGAISALLATGKAGIVPKVFLWAKLQNVPLATSTFNIMLRPAIRKDETEAVNHVLSEMQAHNCQPDIVTFTIILNGLLSNTNSSFHTKTPEAQKTTILTLLKTLQSKGLFATAHTYSTVLDGLLAPQTINLTAARAVLNHMAANNLKPSPHIYTILVTHYFAATPPDLAAIDSLMHRIRLEKGALDSVFYDRMIEGYARAGEVEKMLSFVRRAPREGKSPSWMALLAVLEELVRAREWGFAKEFVADVSDREKGLLRHGEAGGAGKDWFWELVDELREGCFVKEDRAVT